jgi:nucleotide-binding universal stress UspA family protein
MFGRILLAVDDASHSKRSLGYTKELAEKFGSEVIVTHFVGTEASKFGLEASELTPEQREQDFDAFGLSADQMTPAQIAQDRDAMGSAEPMTPEQRAHDVDFVGIAAEQMTPEQLSQDVGAFGIAKSQERPEQLALDRDTVGIPAETLAEWRENAKRLVDECLDTLTSAGLKAQGRVEDGLADERILQFAKENKCDCIVVGASQSGRFARLFGSVGDAVAFKAEVPVLVVP